MIIERLITISQTFPDPVEVCSSLENIWYTLRQYEGRCLRSGLIIKILDIIDSTSCTINAHDPLGSGTMHFKVKVQMLVYYPDEIITGCKIIEKRESVSDLICVKDETKIMVQYKQIMDSLVVGQYIPVIVLHSQYMVGSPEVCVLANLYSFEFTPPVFVLTKFKPDASLYADILDRIKYEEERAIVLKKEEGDTWDMFNKLFYPYKKPEPPPADTESIDVMTLMRHGTMNTKFVCLHPSISLSENKTLVFGSRRAIPDELFIYDKEIPPDEIIIGLLTRYYSYLKMIRENIAVYSQTETIAQEHVNLWRIFNKLKK